MTTVYPQDATDLFGNGRGYCHRGMRAFFARHGLDWSAFVRGGIDAELLRATGDAMALKLADAAEKKRG